MLDDLRIRLRALLRRTEVEQDLEDELRHHLDTQIERYLAEGLSPAAAESRARLEFGGLEQVREECREARGVRFVDDIRQDIGLGLRALRRRGISSAAAVLTLGIGLGVNAAVFAVADWVLWRPLPYPAAHELVGVSSGTGDGAVTAQEFQSFSSATAFRAAAAYSSALRVMSAPGVDPFHVVIARVSGDLFATLAVPFQSGRGFDPLEVAAGAPVVVLSHGLWASRFSSDPGTTGRTVTIDGVSHTILGVLPEDRAWPAGADVWRPLTTAEREDDDREQVMIARLSDGASAERAEQELKTIAPAVSDSAMHPAVQSLQQPSVQTIRPALWALLAAAGLILLMVCANVAALLVARGLDRLGEIGIHGALGATRGRLFRRLLTESAILTVAGTGLGVLLGYWTLGLVVRLAPQDLLRFTEVALDGRILGAGLLTTLIVTLLVGLAPGIQASRLELASVLHSSGTARGPARRRGRQLLVALQTAVAILVTIGAGLLTRSLYHLLRIEHGFTPERLVAIELPLRGVDHAAVPRIATTLIEAAQAVPGVRSAAVALNPPTVLAGLRFPVEVEGIAVRETTRVIVRSVTPGFLETVELPLREGRGFDAGDAAGGPGVALANAAFVRQMLGGGEALGRRLVIDSESDPITITGVVADLTPGGQPDPPALYRPLAQLPVPGGSLLVRTEADPASLVAPLTARLREAMPGVAFDRVRDVADLLAAGRAVTRFNALLAGGFALIALTLATIGIYGLTAGEVGARRSELGVRLALGATRRAAVWTVIRPAARALLAGAVLGLAGTLAVARWVGSLLHGVGPSDPPTLLAVALLLGAVGFGAALIAALPVLRGNLIAALRQE